MPHQIFKSRKLQTFGLALALSIGTIGGMMGFVSLNSAAMAHAQIAVPIPPAVTPLESASQDSAPQRKKPRIVTIHGHENCAIVKQLPMVAGKPVEFTCMKRI